MSQRALDEYSENFDRIFNTFNNVLNEFKASLKLDVRVICSICGYMDHLLHVASTSAKYDQDVNLYTFQRQMEAFRDFAEKFEKAPNDVIQWGEKDVIQWGESVISFGEVMDINPFKKIRK